MNKTQKELDEIDNALVHLIEEENKDMHDNCDMNDCEACTGKCDVPDLKKHYKNLQMFESHI